MDTPILQEKRNSFETGYVKALDFVTDLMLDAMNEPPVIMTEDDVARKAKADAIKDLLTKVTEEKNALD